MVKRYIFLAGPTLKIPSEQDARIAPKTQGSLYFALLQTQLYLIKYRIKRRSALV